MQFQGGVFSEDIPGGRSGVEITVKTYELLATTPDGSEFRLPFTDVEFERGGSSGKMIFCRNTDRSLTIFCENRQFLPTLERIAGPALYGQLEEFRSNTKSKKRASRRNLVFLLLLIAGIGFGGYYGLRLAAHGLVAALPTSFDQQLGKTAFESMEHPGVEVDDPVVVDAITQIVERLKPHGATDDFEYTVRVMDYPIMNAYALPGGYIVVFTGLIEKSERPEQVAGVIAHEMAHVTKRHGLKRLAQSAGAAVAFSLLLGDVEGILALAVGLFEFATINAYSRDDETEADLEGVRMLYEAGIDPIGLAEFFAIMEKEEIGTAPAMPGWFSTHPEHQHRVNDITRILDTYPPKQFEALNLSWDEVLTALDARPPVEETDLQLAP